MNTIIAAVGDNPVGTFAAFDLSTTLGQVALVLTAVVGGSSLLGIGVWQVSKGLDLGIKRFSKISSKS